MRTTHLLITFIAVLAFMFSQQSSAQLDTAAVLIEDSLNARSLIISEVQLSQNEGSWTYAEFSNTSERTLDMTRYRAFARGAWNAPWNIEGYEQQGKRRLTGTLGPKESYLLIQRYGSNAVDPFQNRIYPNGYVNEEANLIANLQAVWSADAPDLPEVKLFANKVGLLYSNQIKEYRDSVYPDSIFIDRFGTDNIERDNNPGINFTIAGINSDDPPQARIYVRKYTVMKGNIVDVIPVNSNPIVLWDLSRGTDISDSEWLPLPKSQPYRYDKLFTTVKYHGPQPEFSISSTVANIDMDGKKISLPQGTSRDSVFRLFDTGLNHAWELKLGADTGQFFVQEDDSLIFYTLGETLETFKFAIKVTGETGKLAQVAPLVYKNLSGTFIKRYDISNGKAPMDTIGTLPYDTPVDTFFKYMVKEEGAEWEIIPVGDDRTPEIKNGDILKVSSADKSETKQYHLGVLGFFPNHNASIETVSFPGNELWENPETFEYTDTMPGFSSNSYFYSIELPVGTKISPAIIATAGDHRSTVVVNRAKDLSGADEDRTATIIVTAEDDTTTLEYKILFNVERETPDVKGSLFITDIGRAWAGYNQSSNISLYNPSTEDVLLSDYALVGIPNMNWQAILDAYALDSNWVKNNAYVFRFGSLVEPSEDLTPVFKSDLTQRTTMLSTNQQYNISSGKGFPVNASDTKAERQELCKAVDFVMFDAKTKGSPGFTNFYGPTFLGSADPYNNGGILPFSGFKADFSKWGIGLARILNDSIKDGIKHVMGDFDTDYEWVDLVGGPSIDMATANLYDRDTIVSVSGNAKNAIYRKSNVYKGNPVQGLSFGTGDDDTKITTLSSEWENFGWDREVGSKTGSPDYYGVVDQRFNNHVLITYAHISYLTSGTYIMEEGLEGPQQVYGVAAGTTVDQFLGSVNKADDAMMIKVMASDGSVLTGTDAITAGTNVWSKSASGLDSVNYVITNLAALSDNCTITSSTYTVSVEGTTGKITGIEIGTSLQDMIADLVAPDFSTMVITNGGEQIVPLMKYNRDTIAIQGKTMTLTLASSKAFVEVTAQDKVAKCIYTLEFNAEDDPFILSDVYVVDEASKVINFAGRTTPKMFKANLIPSTGAMLKIVNKYDQERTDGTMEYSDRVIVTKGDVSVEYWVKYIVNETVIGVAIDDNKAKVLSIYPNPTTDFVTLSGFTGKYVEIRDLAGKILSKKTFDSAEPVIDMRSFSTGIYILTTEKNSFKIIKE